MTTWPAEEPHEAGLLVSAFVIAFTVEAALVFGLSWNEHWLTHKKPADDTSNFIEAQVYELPPEAQLTEEKPTRAKTVEPVLSKVPNRGREAKPEEKNVDEHNQTESGAPQAPTHGPIAVFAPLPQIPTYMQDQEIHASVVIDFLVTAQGVATPRLVGSSGNEELDAIALNTVKKWQFRAAEKDHKTLDAKVRLRVLFEVK